MFAYGAWRRLSALDRVLARAVPETLFYNVGITGVKPGGGGRSRRRHVARRELRPRPVEGSPAPAVAALGRVGAQPPGLHPAPPDELPADGPGKCTLSLPAFRGALLHR